MILYDLDSFLAIEGVAKLGENGENSFTFSKDSGDILGSELGRFLGSIQPQQYRHNNKRHCPSNFEKLDGSLLGVNLMTIYLVNFCSSRIRLTDLGQIFPFNFKMWVNGSSSNLIKK